jgi:hypothetical protein
MADTNKNFLQTVLENVRDAAVNFAKPYQNPPGIPAELKRLLKELGIDDAQDRVSQRLKTVADQWANLGKLLENTQLNFADPAQALAELGKRADSIKDLIDKMLNAPAAVLGDLGAIGNAIIAVFPNRLLDFILYEFITQSHPKIGGAFLLLGVIRRDPDPGGPGLTPANLRVFDFAQLVAAITDPKRAFKKVLRWGTDEFNARPVVDGMVLLADLIQPGKQAGPDDDTFPRAEEGAFVSVAGLANSSARRTLSTPAGVVAFVGLHRNGVGVLVPNPVSVSGGVGSMSVDLPAAILLALTPKSAADDDPRVAVFP